MTGLSEFEAQRATAVEEYPYGTIVHDQEDDDPNAGVVVNVAPAPADDWEAHDGVTVAEDNPGYPANAPVVAVTFRVQLDATIRDWRERESYIAFEELAERAGFYSFPASRLKVARPASEVLDVGNEGPEPPEVVRALADRLGDDNPAPIAYDDDAGHYVVLEKLAETYHVQPGGEFLEGADGALADRVREVAEEL